MVWGGAPQPGAPLVRNPVTGRPIKKYGRAYYQILRQGYQDWHGELITPEEAKRRTEEFEYYQAGITDEIRHMARRYQDITGKALTFQQLGAIAYEDDAYWDRLINALNVLDDAADRYERLKTERFLDELLGTEAMEVETGGFEELLGIVPEPGTLAELEEAKADMEAADEHFLMIVDSAGWELAPEEVKRGRPSDQEYWQDFGGGSMPVNFPPEDAAFMAADVPEDEWDDSVPTRARMIELANLAAYYLEVQAGAPAFLEVAWVDKHLVKTNPNKYVFERRPWRSNGTAISDIGSEESWKRIYSALWALRKKLGGYRVYGALIRWTPINVPAANPADAGMAYDSDEGNCVLNLLLLNFPAKAPELKRIQLNDGGWGESQDIQASRIVKRTIVRVDEYGNEERRTGNFNENGKPREWRYVVKDRHAITEVPKLKTETEILPYPDNTSPEQMYSVMRRAYGSSIAIPTGTGLQLQAGGVTITMKPNALVEALKKRAAELNMNVDDAPLTGSVEGLEARAWRERCGFERCDDPRVWKANNFLKPFSRALTKEELQSYAIDGNKSYWGGWQKRLEYQQYGIPGGKSVVLQNPPIEVLELTGFVLVEYDKCMNGEFSEWIDLQTRGRCQAWASTMLVKSRLDRGWIKINSLKKAIVFQAKYPTHLGEVLCGNEKDIKVWHKNCIGKLVSHNTPDVIYVDDDVTAVRLAHELSSQGKLLSYKKVDVDVWRRAEQTPPTVSELVADPDWDWLFDGLVMPLKSALHTWEFNNLIEESWNDRYVEKFKEDCDRKESAEEIKQALAELAQEQEEEYEKSWQVPKHWVTKIEVKPKDTPTNGYAHVHAYLVDYWTMVLEDQMAKYRWEDIAKVKVDSILLRNGVSYGDVDYGTEPGQWKKEGLDSYVLYKHAWDGITANAEPDTPVDSIPEYPWSDYLTQKQVHFVEGPAGYGKTTSVMQALAGAKADEVVLTPTLKLARKMRKDGARYAFTWQWALWPGKTFDPKAVKLPKRTNIVFFTEALMVSKDRLEPMVEYLVEQGYRVILDGDRKQMRPYMGAFAAYYLTEKVANKEFSYTFLDKKDWRSGYGQDTKEAKATSELKMKVRDCYTNFQAVRVLKEAGHAWNYQGFLDEWKPTDLVLGTVHDVRKAVIADLERIHREKYPDMPKRIRFGSKNRAKSGDEEWIPREAKVPEGAELAHTMTFTVCQGETIHPPDRVWMLDYHLSELYAGAVYTGFSRVVWGSQAALVVDIPNVIDSHRPKPLDGDDVFDSGY